MFEIVIHMAIGLIVGWACGTLPPTIARWAAKNDISFIKRILGIKSPSKHMLGKEECDKCTDLTSGKSDEVSGDECYFCHRAGCHSRIRWGFRVVPICGNCMWEIPNEINTIEP